MYAQAMTQLNQATAADRANIAQGANQATQAFNANYTNAYANAPYAQGAPVAEAGVGLQATVGGGGQGVAPAAADAANSQASFANLLNVLGASEQQAQGSRLNQVALDANTARNALAAQRRGLAGGITMSRAQAYNQWRQAAAERNYQNNLMRQQWQREEATRNAEIANTQAQGNWTQRNEMINNRLTPLLALLGQTAGTSLNMAGIQNLIAGLQR